MNDTQDNKWDKLLHIKTMGRDDSQSDQYRYPYEPTPYSVLQRLANIGLIRKNNMLLDYGCGKGRVDFFLSYQTRCRCLGVEYDERIYEKVMENKKEAVSKERVSFSLANAEEFQLPEQIDRIYFFNPFSVEILRKVMARIMESYYEHPRQPGYFTKKGHFIVLVAIDDNDQVTVADVGSRQRTQYKYPLKEVIAQTKSASAGGPCWEIYSDQKISAKADKKAKQLKAEKKYRSKEFKAMYNEIKSVLQKNYQLAVPLKKGTLVSEEQFVTITSLGINDKVSVMDASKKLTSDVDLDTVVDEIQTEAVKDSFWNTIMIAPDKTNLTDK